MNKVVHTLILAVCVSAAAVISLWGVILLVAWVFTAFGVLSGALTGLFIVLFFTVFCSALEVEE